MAQVFIEETTLTAIGDAIRGKEGTTELVPVIDMATRITNLPSGGGGGGNEPTDEELVFTGTCSYLFSENKWNWFIAKYGSRITTTNVSNCQSLFHNSNNLKTIPFQINVANCSSFGNLLNSCYKLSVCPKVRGAILWNTSTSFDSMLRLNYDIRDIEDLFTPEMIEGFSTVKVTSAYSTVKATSFYGLYSLRKIPSWWYKFRVSPESTAYPSASYTIYYNMLNNCYSIDTAENIPVWTCSGAQTSNMFSSSFDRCNRLKDITFETNEDGTPIVVKWKSQTIDLSKNVGYYFTSDSANSFATNVNNRNRFVTSNCYNSGITEDKLIYNDETYQLLKDDLDSYAVDCGGSSLGGLYSRYNHDSAVNTINSLPDTSAYLATAGGTNTIKFKGTSGSLTDGGAINTLTEEEIAVATAKGWTVTLQ